MNVPLIQNSMKGMKMTVNDIGYFELLITNNENQSSEGSNRIRLFEFIKREGNLRFIVFHPVPKTLFPLRPFITYFM